MMITYSHDIDCFQSVIPHQSPDWIFYQNFKHFDRNSFQKQIKNMLVAQKISQEIFLAFQSIVLEALNYYAPLKTKY